MKRTLGTLLIAAMLCCTLGMGSAQAAYTPGDYSAAAKGFGGPVTVTLTVDETQIVEAKVEGAGETEGIGGAALPLLAEQIQAQNGAEIDGVAGATVTSGAVREACAAALAAARGEASTSAHFTPGTYTGTAQGMWEPLTVSVTVSQDAIEAVEVTECQDTPIVSDAAIREVPARIVAEQSLAVDTASGATVSSNAIIAATKSALSQASDDLSALTAPLPEKEILVLPDEEYDVVIVGAGGAGLSAAVELGKTSDLSVLVLEKEAWIGGATALSGSGISVGGTVYNQPGTISTIYSKTGKPVDFTPEEVVEYFHHKTETLSDRPEDMWINEELVYRVFERASSYYPFLVEEGLNQTTAVVLKPFAEEGRGIMGLIGAQEYAASHIWGFWFSDVARKYGAEIRVNSPVTSLINEDGKVAGVVVEGKDGTYRVKAKKVILATGGYSANRELLRETCSDLFPHIDEIFTFTTPGVTGDAIEMVKPFDGAYTGYGLQTQFGVYPPYAFETALGNEAYGNHLDVDAHGDRYVEELSWYYDKGEEFRKLDTSYGYAVFNALSYFSAPHRPDMTFDQWVDILKENGWIFQADSVEELAAMTGMDAAKLDASIDAYNEYCVSGAVSDFGYPPPPVDKDSTLYALRMQMCMTDTMYGLKQDAQFRVLNNSGAPIPNLYAAGTVGFGNYELQKYYSSTTAIAIAVYGGSIAADEVVAEIQAETNH